MTRQGRSSTTAKVAGASLVNPWIAWAVHAGAIWLWHLPGPYQFALENDAAHALEHASFFTAGIGPSPMKLGSTPAVRVATTLASGSAPDRLCFQ